MLYYAREGAYTGIAERGAAMKERRKNKRTAMDSKLLMKRLDGEEHTEVDIEVADLSKTGVGFISNQLLKVGQVYEAYLKIWTQEVLHVFLRIVRIELQGTEYIYGAVFVGMSETDAARIEVYQTVNDNN
jgi:hypothetical protein